MDGGCSSEKMWLCRVVASEKAKGVMETCTGAWTRCADGSTYVMMRQGGDGDDGSAVLCVNT